MLHHALSLPAPILRSRPWQHPKFAHRMQSTVTRPRRRLSVFRLFIGAGFSMLIGFFAGMLIDPVDRAFWKGMMSAPKSSQDTLSAYEAPDPATAAIDAHILNSQIAKTLRKQPAFTESRPQMRVPAPLRPTNLTAGTLAGPGRIVVPPLNFNEDGGKSLVSIFYLGEQLCGHPGIVHGGLLATLLDEGLARCCFPAMPNKLGVTANLEIDYRKPARAKRYYVLKAQTVKVEGRKAWVKGWIETMDDKEPVKVVEATALFIEPKNAKVSVL